MSCHTYTHTYTHDNYYNPRCACAPRVNYYRIIIALQFMQRLQTKTSAGAMMASKERCTVNNMYTCRNQPYGAICNFSLWANLSLGGCFAVLFFSD